jgi:hypothetical protein
MVILRGFEDWCATYEKLVKWGIRIHVGIDGGNHFVLWACVAMNK